jgi:hypothetical protein
MFRQVKSTELPPLALRRRFGYDSYPPLGHLSDIIGSLQRGRPKTPYSGTVIWLTIPADSSLMKKWPSLTTKAVGVTRSMAMSTFPVGAY